MIKYALTLLLPCCLIASEPPWKDVAQPKRSQDFPGVDVIHRGNTPPPGSSSRADALSDAPKRAEGSRDLRKQIAKNSCKKRITDLLNYCKGDK